jgi:hypothetical protein
VPQQKKTLLLLANDFLLLRCYAINACVIASKPATSNETLKHFHLTILVHAVVATTYHAWYCELTSLHAVLVVSLLHLHKLLELLVV